MQPVDLQTITIEPLLLPVAQEKEITIDVLRLDKIHPVISGNKWFKLRLHIKQALQEHKKTIITFGGAWSNHLIATAAACQLNGLRCTGLVRGHVPIETDALMQARQLGMQIHFLAPLDYKAGIIPEHLQQESHYCIAAGGYGPTGATGASGITELYDSASYTHICCAAGTGTMSAGLLMGSQDKTTVVAVSVLKSYAALEEDILALYNPPLPSLQVIHDYHFGGYAKHTPALFQFMNDFYSSMKIPTDFVYTAKAFFGVLDLARNNYFAPGSRLLMVHSGGLQGNRSLGKGTLIF